MPDDSHFFSPSLWSLRWKVWPPIVKFFCVRFLDDRTEERFHKEHWFTKKVSPSFQTAPSIVPVSLSCCKLGPRRFFSRQSNYSLRQNMDVGFHSRFDTPITCICYARLSPRSPSPVPNTRGMCDLVLVSVSPSANRSILRNIQGAV
ncbi:hypothetical protein JVT61DRAFT_346 [Boletus reticuloceps]|uniref:Uncharacterized protein n=1 Tax=Boletus reticuloceps TaxID=495285 RepID=A0A8I3AGM8_9AGAM|nr:hypothetical protein JVT61DRAFT_346 [Boletus reticuloceps]